MKNLIVAASLILASVSSFATDLDADIATQIAAEKQELTRVTQDLESLKLRCQDEIADLNEEIATMDAAKGSPATLEEQLELITMRREYVESADSSCKLEKNEEN